MTMFELGESGKLKTADLQNAERGFRIRSRKRKSSLPKKTFHVQRVVLFCVPVMDTLSSFLADFPELLNSKF